MRIFILFLIVSFYSCEKCMDCKRTWTITDGNNGQLHTTYSTEYFEECGSVAINNAEAGEDKERTYLSNTHWVDSSAVCSCH